MDTWSGKGDRWVERILSVEQTCRMHDIPTYPRLVQALSDYLKGQPTRCGLDPGAGVETP